MELLPFQADVEIGLIIEVPIAMYHVNTETRETIAFTDCSHLPLDLSSDKQGVFTLYKEGKAKLFLVFFFILELRDHSPL